ncbi:MAG: type II 3-dehydroquinate dehydratase [Halorhodospira halophila]|uniref:type II 3-dehydroquinate dehydratase n=1 Tax=Halorhodospira TaxID=85108 RepID=UPI0019136375|nr:MULTISPECIES: type II 3-dehydroquinate dehydratase [Halorhodospira]MBK5935298.1 type II 3-dehydroquinate dehydratase [Halorhodospira halophila]MBK5944647.1 type II 3-dehydroquinate dehydratase [Halorhodospira halophila]MCC3751522.1 type II 3-dehydroquinate dehydratase [Halorhodospira halophila]MCG5527210.1 type II 3-dehydroquinate dehydratase [Halorhodospira halophila]MCG5532563.1 type II 3-dehydroquinate dehydratase [Halorhodospira sp. 9621]
MPKLLLIHGPNLNRLGTREPERYGRLTLQDIETRLRSICDAADVQLHSAQSNHEGELIDRIHAAADEGVEFIVINPAALTHTSVGLRDALLAVALPFIEVHLSNVHAREAFRQHSFLSDIAEGVVTGLGADGYEFAVRAAIRRMGGQA